MTRAKAPCYDTETVTDCPERRVGCREACSRWKEYREIHEREHRQILEQKRLRADVNSFLHGQEERTRAYWNDRSQQKNRRRK